MSARAISGDLSVWSINSVSQLAFLGDASIMIDHEDVDGSPITRIYESSQIVGSSGTVKCSLMSVLSGSTKVNNLDVSAFTIGGTNYLANLDSGSIQVEWTHQEGKAVGTQWAYPVVTKKKISMDATLKIPTTSGAGLMLLMDSATSGLEVVASITINSIATTFPGLLKSVDHSYPQGGIQTHKVQIKGRNTDTGTFPTAPSGTSSILELFLNTLASIAFAITSKASGGAVYSGNMLPKSLNLQWANGQLVMVDVEFATQGAVTITESA